MASADSSSSPPRSPASRFRRACCRSFSRSTRSRLRSPPASTWTTPSSCPPASRRSAWGRGKRWWCNRSPFSRRCSTSRASGRGAPPISSASACTRSKTCSTGFRSATKIAARSRRLRRCGLASPPRSLGEVVGCGIRPTRRPRFKIFELLVRDRHRLAARDLVQPAVSQRRLPAASARHPVRQARADVARAADAEPAVRDPAAGQLTTADAGDAPTAGGRRDAAHRTHRPDLREDRDRHDEDAARARAPRAGAAARRCCRIRCRRRSATRQQLVDRRDRD